MRLFYKIAVPLMFMAIQVAGQREIYMSQYMYNKYTINPAFGGSNESLSAYASYRKKWLGFKESPTGMFFTINSPLKNEKMALGAQLFNNKFAVSQNTGFNLSYSHRFNINKQTTLAFGIAAGFVNYKSDWTKVRLSDENTIDELFSTTEQSNSPWLSFGISAYTNTFFAGFSVPSILHYNRYTNNENTLNFSKIDYLFTAGFIHKFNKNIAVQPSALIRVNMDDTNFIDVSATGIFMNSLMIGTSYRSTNQIVGIIGYQITQQFRFTYSLDYDIDPIGSYNNGTHEIALQFDFGYKINSPDPKFF